MTTKSDALKAALLRRLREEKRPAHHRLPTERALAEEFGCTQVTVHKAVEAAVREGHLYQKARKGTFVSPEVVRGLILVVIPASWDGAFDEFFKGLSRAVHEEDLRCVLLPVFAEDLRRHRRDLPLVYRDLWFVIFFRDMDALRDERAALRKAGIPCAVFGSDRHEEEVSDFHRILVPERRVAELAFAALGREVPSKGKGTTGNSSRRKKARTTGPVRFASVSFGYAPHEARRNHFEKICEAEGFRSGPSSRFEIPEWPRLYEDRTLARLDEWLDRFDGSNVGLFATSEPIAAALLARSAFSRPSLRLVYLEESAFRLAENPRVARIRLPVQKDAGRLLRAVVKAIRENGPTVRERSIPFLSSPDPRDP